MVSPLFLLIPGAVAVYHLVRPAAAPVAATTPAAPVQAPPRPPEIAPGVPVNEKTVAYRSALLLQQQTEARAKGIATAAMAYAVPGEALSASDLPPAAPGFRWVRTQMPVKMGAKEFSLWQYVSDAPMKPVVSTPSSWAQIAATLQPFAQQQSYK